MTDLLHTSLLPTSRPATDAGRNHPAGERGVVDNGDGVAEAIAVARVAFGRDISAREARWLWRGALGGFYAAGLDDVRPSTDADSDEPIDIRADLDDSGQSALTATTTTTTWS